MLFHAVFALEALDSACGIDQPLLAGVKGMTLRADFDAKLRQRRASLEGVATCASNNASAIFGMDSRLHNCDQPCSTLLNKNITARRPKQFSSRGGHWFGLNHVACSKPLLSFSGACPEATPKDLAAARRIPISRPLLCATGAFCMSIITIISTAALLLAIFCGCSSRVESPSMLASPAGAPTPRVVTDLSTLSSAPPAGSPTAPRAGTAATKPNQGGASPADEAAELRRLFLTQPESQKFAGTAAKPAHERLLNAKAAQFSEFSGALLHQVVVAAQELEGGQFARRNLPEDLNKVIITATMSREGKLKELVLEQQSGSGAVDHLMIDACKRGLWVNNPPPEALSSDGDYKFRIEGRLKNFNSTDRIHWNFATDVGLALL
jgi:hypothetical protein